MFGIDFCDIKMKSRYYFKFSWRHQLYAVPANIYIIEAKSQKDVVYFQPEDNHETRIAESEKVCNKLQAQTRFENYFYF